MFVLPLSSSMLFLNLYLFSWLLVYFNDCFLDFMLGMSNQFAILILLRLTGKAYLVTLQFIQAKNSILIFSDTILGDLADFSASIQLMEPEVSLYWRTVCKHLQMEAQVSLLFIYIFDCLFILFQNYRTYI